jgi:hypothetical protein
MTRPSYIVGLDLGQSRDYTALCVIEEPVWIADEDTAFKFNVTPGWVSPADMMPLHVEMARQGEHYRRPERPVLACRHLERFPLNTPYPAIVDRVASVLASPLLAQRAPVLVVDATGVGAPVVDLFRQRELQPIAVTITGGTAITHAGTYEYGVPKRDLVSTIAVLLEQRRLKIAEALPEARTLMDELQRFQRTVTRNGGDSYETPWREQAHDDLVLAVALAGWFREWWNVHLDNAMPSMVFGRSGRMR